jgi:hypothetical protein
VSDVPPGQRLDLCGAFGPDPGTREVPEEPRRQAEQLLADPPRSLDWDSSGAPTTSGGLRGQLRLVLAREVTGSAVVATYPTMRH